MPKPCVDTGMGFERLAAVLQGVHNNYDIDLFKALIARAGELLNCKDLENDSLKVISDHIRASAFLIADGVLPSNEGRGYVMRRIIRRALRQGHKLQSKGPFFHKMVGELVNQMGDAYPILKSTQAQIEKVLLKEEEQFELTLDQGMKILNEAIGQLQGDVIPGSVVFKLYDTYGFPTDLTNDIAREKNLSIDMDGFEVEMDAQRARARAASKFGSIDVDNFKVDDVTKFVGYESLIGESVVSHLFQNEQKVDAVSAGDEVVLVLNATPFYAESGGQAGDSGKLFSNGVSIVVSDTIKSSNAFLHKGTVIEGTICVGDSVNAEVERLQRDRTRLNHSATHLLHAALRIVLGDHVNQRGSLVDAERMRFDFSHFEGVTKEELVKVELLVNEQIRGNSEIQTELMNLEDAREKGAMALFGEKYSEAVRVLTMGDGFSIELCGGTHASRTGDIGLMKITSEVGIASGVRRIEAVTGAQAFELVLQQEQTLEDFSGLLRSDKNGATDKLKSLIEQNKKLEKEVSQLNMKLASGGGKDLADSAVEINGVKVVAQLLEGGDAKTLPDAMDRVKTKLQSGVVLLAVINDDKVVLVAGVTKDLTDKVKAGDLLNYVATQVGGKGGGRPDMARGGGTDTKA
ncbi:MAG: alanine--tRNA ligase, partial [Pseudomonadales bacterium]